jgi:hypothetical protein
MTPRSSFHPPFCSLDPVQSPLSPSYSSSSPSVFQSGKVAFAFVPSPHLLPHSLQFLHNLGLLSPLYLFQRDN